MRFAMSWIRFWDHEFEINSSEISGNFRIYTRNGFSNLFSGPQIILIPVFTIFFIFPKNLRPKHFNFGITKFRILRFFEMTYLWNHWTRTPMRVLRLGTPLRFSAVNPRRPKRYLFLLLKPMHRSMVLTLLLNPLSKVKSTINISTICNRIVWMMDFNEVSIWMAILSVSAV